jgi:hypothetical protein
MSRASPVTRWRLELWLGAFAGFYRPGVTGEVSPRAIYASVPYSPAAPPGRLCGSNGP